MMYRILFLFSFLSLLLYAENNRTDTDLTTVSQEENLSSGSESISKEEEKLRLMFQVFTYASDLKNAYKVGTKALEKFPESLYWHQKMAEISQWLNKGSEAIKHYTFVYQKTHNKDLEKKILNYALSAYQYETAAPILKSRTLKDPSDRNIEKMIDIYDKIGSPEEAASTLVELSRKKKHQKKLLSKALIIYMEAGDNEEAAKLIKKLEQNGKYDLKTGEAIASYYLAQKDILASYKALKHVDKNTLGKNAVKYYRQMSDTGWYLQNIKSSVLASLKLQELGAATLPDYEHIITFFQGKKPELVSTLAQKGYQKFGKKYLYITWLNTLFAQKHYAKLVSAIEKSFEGSMRKELYNDVNIWLMLAQAYGALNRNKETVNAFKKALALEPNSADIESAILWYYIDHKHIAQTKEMIFEIEERNPIPKPLWLPLAVGNFSLQRSDRAMEYVKQLRQEYDDIIDIKFMYAYLMQTREETGAFMMTMEDIYDTLESKRKKDPSLMNDSSFLENYLKSGMYFIPVDDFEMELKRAKSILSPKNYTEIAIFQSLRHNAMDRARYLSGMLKNVEPWMQLSIALYSNARADQEELLYRYYTILPIRDRVTTALNTGNIALSQTLTFDGLEQNRHDFLLYQQMRDITEKYANKVTIRGGIQQRRELDRTWMDFSSRYYLDSAWTLLANVNLVHNQIQDYKTLIDAPSEESLFEIAMHRRFMRGEFSLHAGVRSAMETFPFAKAKLHYDIHSRISIDAEIGLDVLSAETTYLLFGGKKKEVQLKTSFQYLPSSSISFKLSGKHFYSQDDIYLGKGYHALLEWYKQLHNGYPDIAWGLFAEYGWYSEKKDRNTGVIDKLIYYEDTLILPETFYTIGANFYYGAANKQYYTRVWRPYASFSPYYNGLLKQFNFSFDAGIGGAIYDRDHLNFGISYDQSVNGTNESNLQIYIQYKHFFN